MGKMSDKERSGLQKFDAVVLVVIGIVVGVLFFGFIHVVFNLVWFVVKLVVLVAIIFFVARLLLRRRK